MITYSKDFARSSASARHGALRSVFGEAAPMWRGMTSHARPLGLLLLFAAPAMASYNYGGETSIAVGAQVQITNSGSCDSQCWTQDVCGVRLLVLNSHVILLLLSHAFVHVMRSPMELSTHQVGPMQMAWMAVGH